MSSILHKILLLLIIEPFEELPLNKMKSKACLQCLSDVEVR